MAFGFGFNKQKVLSAAEKYVQQGKMQNAIAEYEKIIKADPKELTVTNTIGDLYSRLGDADKATDCFKTVGDAYAAQGFTVKAIAMYKKISKLKPSLESLLKLAELYTQQGLFNDARSQYLQVADEFIKSGELENAVRIFQKILEMDPENSAMRVRLAEVYVRLGKKTEAWKIFSAAAETLRNKGSLSGAEEVLQRMLTLDPGNSYALLMQGRNLLNAGDAEGAITSLQKVTDLDSNPDGLRDLLKAYLKSGRLSDAGTLANKLLTVHNDLSVIFAFADALMRAGQYENALQVYDQHADRLLADDSDKVVKNLHSIIGHVRDNPASLEKLLELFQKSGESTHVTEVIELLAHASVQCGDLQRARDLYQKLTTMEPGNPLHLNNYQQVISQLGGPSAEKLISAEEAAVIVDELEATSPAVHQHYSDSVALAVRAALTDAELFISYNMPAKALGPLMAALPLAPEDLRLNQRLAALHTRAARFAEAGVCCRTLQNTYSEAGHPEEATRYGELAERYEVRSAAANSPMQTIESPGAGTTQTEVAPDASTAATPWPTTSDKTADDLEFAIVADEGAEHAQAGNEISMEGAGLAESTASGASEAMPEIDLSSEWDDTITIDADAVEVELSAQTATGVSGEEEAVTVEAGAANHTRGGIGEQTLDAEQIAETIAEIRFYHDHGMPEQAMAGLEKIERVAGKESAVIALRAEMENAPQQISFVEEVAPVESVAEFTVEEPAAELTADEVQVVADEPASVPENSELPAVEAEVAAPQAEPALADAPVVEAAAETNPGVLQELVSDIESSLGESFLPGAAAKTEQPTASTMQAHSIPPDVTVDERAVSGVSSEHKVEAIGELVADLEASLGDDFLKGAPVAETESASKTKTAPMAASAAAGASSAGSIAPSGQTQVSIAQQSEAATVESFVAAPDAGAIAEAGKSGPPARAVGVDLAEMFGELRQDLEAGASPTEEDPETHYNLGIAFREMGLLDEAIGELQKTCQAIDHGHPFPQVMQTYTWLAQCFLDKGVPEAALRWYDKALLVPGADQETLTALHYELASAYEACGDKRSALKNFMEVYGRNIDYRDVAERIKALKS